MVSLHVSFTCQLSRLTQEFPPSWNNIVSITAHFFTCAKLTEMVIFGQNYKRYLQNYSILKMQGQKISSSAGQTATNIRSLRGSRKDPTPDNLCLVSAADCTFYLSKPVLLPLMAMDCHPETDRASKHLRLRLGKAWHRLFQHRHLVRQARRQKLAVEQAGKRPRGAIRAFSFCRGVQIFRIATSLPIAS